ncbi:ABC transporter ATP-binding protein [Aestuariivirga sp. YIM B02566]|uniref:Sn-glycerol-3-phosphate ABC transporter ATP-binding protein UgpC n=1 Tax=Taklimakanibacter albus TaxID=2800327 RepID=A0ACC5RBJ2_9HYPH|nr:sn-glycerol-3-phosphate ABC transporter ATP-binding protein UgpC [Aestuariivirga sp. YIM B02566]MBK1869856.1 sn-glycerol-3-phosphate ABC transporter ATP-binding protein UgpC [Aestuariivirga sp. YIM B02566]
MASVSLRNVHKKFGPITVLESIDLDIADGEFVVLVGPSGCGKSTLLRSIAGLEAINGGEIQIGDRPVTHMAPKDRDIAMVFQSYALYPHMDVRRNMAFSLNLRKSPAALIGERVAEASAKLGLNALLDRLPKQLSGGQRQRVAMGRAIVRNPKVFLFDEPLSNLDAKLRATMRTEIKALHQSLKTTAIYVTHDQVEAMTMANRIVVMSDGVIQQVGPPLELYDRPANMFVAGFIGSPTMNFFDAVIVRGAARLADGSLLPLAPAAWKEGREIVIGIRPEHLHFADQGFPATVTVVEPLGMSTQVTLDAVEERVTLLALERPQLSPGDRKYLTAKAADIHVFDRVSGLRLN